MKAPFALVSLALGFAVMGPAWADPPSASLRTLARESRLSLGLGFGMGTAAMDGFPASDFRASLQRQNPAATFGEEPVSHLQMGAELSLRYYHPQHFLLEVGYDALYNSASMDASAGANQITITNDNLVMEVPVLVGGYVALGDRTFLQGALGPAYYFFARSYWDSDQAGVQDFRADNGMGLHALVGASHFVNDAFALDLEARYRRLETGELKELKTGTTLTTGLFRGDGSKDTYHLDFSGVSLLVRARFFIL
jgi:opacity protein-like surface antigen